MNWKAWLHSLVAAAIGGAATSLSAILIAPASFNFTHAGLANLGKVALAGAVIPVLALLKQSPLPTIDKANTQPISTAGQNLGCIAFLAFAAGICFMFTPDLVSAQTTPAPTPAGFVASSDAMEIGVGGKWGLGNLTTESFDFLDYGASKSNRVFIQGIELSAPSASFSVFGGGILWQPDLTALLKKTNLPVGNFIVFADANAGDGMPATGTSRVSAVIGGGLKYILSDNLTWNTLRYEEVFFGSSRYPAISTGIAAYFGGTPATAAASPTVKASLLKRLARAAAQTK